MFSVFVSSTWPGLARAERENGDWAVRRVCDLDVRCLAAAPDGGRLFAGTQGDGLWSSNDRGKTWQRLGLERSIVKSIATTPAAPDLVLAGTKPPQVFVSRDRGSTWRELDSFQDVRGRKLWRQPAERPSTPYVQALAVAPSDPDLIIAGMEAGAVVRSTDGGTTWSNHLPGACRDCHSLTFHATDGERVYQAGGGVINPGIALSNDSGARWTRPREGIDRRYGWAVAADPEDPNVCYVSLSPGAMKAHANGKADAYIFRTTDGERWMKLAGGLPQPLDSMPYALLTDEKEPGHLYAGLADGRMWFTEDRGDIWTKLDVELPSIHRSLTTLR